MTPVRFLGYGVNGGRVTVIAERILTWHGINYNGNPGTEITLDNGSRVTVQHYSSDVERMVREAVATGADGGEG